MKDNKLFLEDFVNVFTNGNHGNTLWQSVMSSLRPADLPDEATFIKQLNEDLVMLHQAGVPAMQRRNYKRTKCASYWPGPPGNPELIKALEGEYAFGVWISQEGLRRYTAIFDTIPLLLNSTPGLSHSGLIVLKKISKAST